MLSDYRKEIGETPAHAPLASRIYDDATLLAGVATASRLAGVPADTLLQEYGRYFIMNGLTSHLCTYVLSQVQSASELLHAMREVHARLRQTHEGVTPPLFRYEAPAHANEVRLVYDSDRKLCSVLWGAIEGAAERYGERVRIRELSCMKRGGEVCRFIAEFSGPRSDAPSGQTTPEHLARREQQQQLRRRVLSALPGYETVDGATLSDLRELLLKRGDVDAHQLRPAVLLEALQQLQFAGLVKSSANQAGDNLLHRRYWRFRHFRK
jgi:predicted hydrocarbon binding protein